MQINNPIKLSPQIEEFIIHLSKKYKKNNIYVNTFGFHGVPSHQV